MPVEGRPGLLGPLQDALPSLCRLTALGHTTRDAQAAAAAGCPLAEGSIDRPRCPLDSAEVKALIAGWTCGAAFYRAVARTSWAAAATQTLRPSRQASRTAISLASAVRAAGAGFNGKTCRHLKPTADLVEAIDPHARGTVIAVLRKIGGLNAIIAQTVVQWQQRGATGRYHRRLFFGHKASE